MLFTLNRFGKRAMFGVYAFAAYLFVAHIAYDALTLPIGSAGSAAPSGYVEDVTFPSRGQNYPVHAFYLPGKPGYPALISVHGYRGSRHDQFHMERAEALRNLGYSVVSLDLAGHGGDTLGKGRIAMGYSERWDVLGGYDYLLQKGFKPAQIGIVGESLGAATSLLATAAEPRIRAVWADSAYARAISVIVDRGITAGYPALITPLIPGGMLLGWLTTGDRIWEANPVDVGPALASNHQAVYLVHDEKDTTVPFYHSELITAAYSAAHVNFTFWRVPDLEHAAAFMVLRDDYLRRLDAFFKRYLEFEL